MVKSYKVRIMNPEIKKPEGWPYLEVEILFEDEGTGLYNKVPLLIDYDNVEIYYFYQSIVRFSKGDPKEVTVIKLSNEETFKVAMKYARFKKLMLEWYDYYNHTMDDVFELELDTTKAPEPTEES